MGVGVDDLAKIDAAIASGVLTVRASDGRTTTFRSVEELIKARRELVAQQQANQGTRRRRTVRLYQSGRGL